MSRIAWSAADIADFEYLLFKDSSLQPDVRHQQDRRLFEAVIAPGLKSGIGPDRRDIFHGWLMARRQAAREYLPGQDLVATWKFAFLLLATVSFFVGIALVSGLLATMPLGTPQAPIINVMRVFMVTVGLPLLLTLIALAVMLLLAVIGRRVGGLPSMRLAAFAFTMRRLAAWQGGRLRGCWSLASARLDLYRGLASWHVTTAMQACFAAMSAGVVVSLLALHLLAQNPRFGWASFYEGVTATRVDAVVGWVSVPWSRLLPHARPDFKQIEESNASEPDDKVEKSASRAWGWFLVCAIAVWGIAFRVILMVISLCIANRCNRTLAFTHEAAEDLWNRLTTPLPTAPIPAEPTRNTENVVRQPWWRRMLTWSWTWRRRGSR